MALPMNPPKNPKPIQNLIDSCLHHLVSERQLLERFVEHSQQIHDSLGSSVFPSDESIREIEQHLTTNADKVSAERARIRQMIVVQMNVSEKDATVKNFADKLTEQQAAPLLEQRKEILRLHKQIASMSESNALLLQQSIDIYQRILQSLAGHSTPSQTYSSSGKVTSQSTVSLVSTQG